MFNNPIFESAFKQLDMLCEQDFNLNRDAVAEIKDFMDNDEIEDEVDVIDLDAEKEEDLDDSNIGKIILQCPCCETVIMKPTNEIELPEEDSNDEQLIQIGEQCPICFSEEGYKIIGQVAPYEEIEVEIEPKEKDTEEDFEDDSMDMDDVENLDDNEDDEFKESLNEARWTPCNEVDAFGNYTCPYMDGDSATGMYFCRDNCGVGVDEDSYEGSYDYVDDDYEESLKKRSCKGEKCNKSLEEADDYSSDDKVIDLINSKNESLNEGINDIQLETDNDKISIHAEQKAAGGEEMIAPLDFQSANEIVDNQDSLDGEDDYLNDIQTEDDNDILGSDDFNSDDNIEGENFAQGEEEEFSDYSDDAFEDTEDKDVPVEDFDEESFDKLGESYFKTVYDNVKSYVTESVSENKDNLIVEGIITFASGNKKKTSFVLEGHTITPSGRCTMLVENKQITPGKKGYSISGTLKKGKFITESFNYNYNCNGVKVKGNIKF